MGWVSIINLLAPQNILKIPLKRNKSNCNSKQKLKTRYKYKYYVPTQQVMLEF